MLAFSMCLVLLGCGEATNEEAVDARIEMSESPVAGGTDGPLEILGVDNEPLSAFFTKRVDVFGVDVVATEATPDDKVLHAANVMAQVPR